MIATGPRTLGVIFMSSGPARAVPVDLITMTEPGRWRSSTPRGRARKPGVLYSRAEMATAGPVGARRRRARQPPRIPGVTRMIKRRIGAGALLAAAILARPVPAAGQEENKDFKWTLSGEARYRPEWRDNTDLNDRINDETRQGY